MDVSVVVAVAVALGLGLVGGRSHRGGATSDEGPGPALGPPGQGPRGPIGRANEGAGGIPPGIPPGRGVGGGTFFNFFLFIIFMLIFLFIYSPIRSALAKP